MISIQASGNCNFQYLSSLRGYHPNRMEQALKDLFTAPANMYTKKPVFRNPQCAFLIFAQGSEDPIKTKPYAPEFQELIENYNLGEVWRSKPGPNPMHYGKPGTLFVWQLDYDAITTWWNKNVRDSEEK